jgi:hypothetical protein
VSAFFCILNKYAQPHPLPHFRTFLLIDKHRQVCFSGDGNYAARIRPADLDRMFQAAVVEVTCPYLNYNFVYLSQEHRVSVAHPPNNQARVLPISQKFLFHVKVSCYFGNKYQYPRLRRSRCLRRPRVPAFVKL